MVVDAITLGQPVLPGRLPFSKPKVNWLLQEKTVKNTGGVNHVLFTQHRRFQDGSLREPIAQRANERLIVAHRSR